MGSPNDIQRADGSHDVMDILKRRFLEPDPSLEHLLAGIRSSTEELVEVVVVAEIIIVEWRFRQRGARSERD